MVRERYWASSGCSSTKREKRKRKQHSYRWSGIQTKGTNVLHHAYRAILGLQYPFRRLKKAFAPLKRHAWTALVLGTRFGDDRPPVVRTYIYTESSEVRILLSQYKPIWDTVLDSLRSWVRLFRYLARIPSLQHIHLRADDKTKKLLKDAWKGIEARYTVCTCDEINHQHHHDVV